MADVKLGAVLIGIALLVAILSFVYVNRDANIVVDRDERLLGNGSFVGEEDYDSDDRTETFYVDIEDFAFSPETLTVKKGNRVVWTNRDSAKHTVTSDSDGELDSDLLSRDEEYSHIFDDEGVFGY